MPVFSLLVLSLYLVVQPLPKNIIVRGEVLSLENGAPVARGSMVFLRAGQRHLNVRVVDGKFESEMPAGEGYRLILRAPGFAEIRRNSLGVYPDMQPLTFRLKPLLPIQGLIVDAEGKGIAQARVAFALDPEGKEVLLSVSSREDGSFGMGVANGPGEYFLRIFHSLYQDPEAVSFSLPLTGDLTIELKARDRGELGSISGELRLPGESTQAGARILLVGSGHPDYRTVEVNELGEFYFDDVVPGRYSVELMKSDLFNIHETRKRVDVVAGENARVLIAFAASESVLGLVVNRSGDPIKNVRVSLESGYSETYALAQTQEEILAMERRAKRPLAHHSTQTDDEGAFRFAAVEAGPYLLRARPLDGSNYPEKLQSIEIPIPDRLVVELEEGVTLRAVLLDHDGNVISRFSFGYSLFEAAGSGNSMNVSSVDGLFVVPGLRQATYDIRVHLFDGRKANAYLDLNRGSNISLQMPKAPDGELLVTYH